MGSQFYDFKLKFLLNSCFQRRIIVNIDKKLEGASWAAVRRV